MLRCHLQVTVALVGMLLLPPASASAMSCGGSFSVWPPPATTALPLNACIVLEGAMWPSTVVGNVADHHPVLRSRLEEVPLVVNDVYRARQDAFTQVVLVTTRRLSPWTRYSLGFRHHPPGRAHETAALDGLRLSWTTGASLAGSAPVWSGEPLICDARSSEWGEFSDASITLAVPAIHAATPVRILVELDTYDPRYHPFYPMRQLLPVDRGQLVLASGSCLGPFYLGADSRYFGSLTAVDLAGNQARWLGSLAFRVPNAAAPASYEVHVERPLTPLRDVPVPYPSIARKAGVTGVVEVELDICPEGQVEQVKVTRSAPLFDQAVVTAASAWSFEAGPSRRRVPVAVRFLERRPMPPPQDWRW